MKRVMRKAVPVFVLSALLAPLAQAESLGQKGRVIADSFCSRCHAVGPRGKSPNPKSPPFRTLGRKYPLADLEEALGEGIVVGHEGQDMPPFVFSSEDIKALLAYLASVQKK
ncbi:c-type cytochrome [Methylocystis heyeri]|uniref:C-type cytochrome n=1 Tax=Methylocystis heyeri TaxID=391905 RepID=A0A6B8KDF9_9HYPH|nr:c-type cytochrome [Methylocystis heyeri]QGM44463.1 c-type cytochrome [Methylocystis heyeri]